MIFLLACSEFVLGEPPPVPPADPPPEDPDADYGDPPDWTTCTEGWFGQYYNLPGDHPDLEAEAAPDGWEDLDWWDDERVAFRRFDAQLDLGSGWWPVDEGLEADPDYFAARWTAWIRATDDAAIQVVLGADTVAWLGVNYEPAARVEGAAQLLEIPVRAGQFPIELRFGQLRAGESGLRFRIASGEVVLCYPEFEG